ncbi:MAG: N-acetylmuramoyl-L-alanine amidase family protein [Armatimonadota bacterium]
MSKLICIDPGHGGPKPGSTGKVVANGKSVKLLEKDVVFGLNDQALGGNGVANRVGHHLRANGLHTVFTRSSDCDVDLSERARLAVRNKAGLFVSVHCNSFADTKSCGIEVYVHPSQKNHADQLARHILDEVLARPECSHLRDRGVKTAKYRVLQGTYTRMPAVLVELPFISNPNEAKLLADRHFRESAAIGIAEGIRKFIG